MWSDDADAFVPREVASSQTSAASSATVRTVVRESIKAMSRTFDKSFLDGTGTAKDFKGLNALGLRQRHPVWHQWIAEERSVDYVLEHLVDTVLAFDGDRHHALRLLRAAKHRFGATSELGLEDALIGIRGHAVASADIDGDGWNDLVFVLRHRDRVAVFLNGQDGTFSEEDSTQVGTRRLCRSRLGRRRLGCHWRRCRSLNQNPVTWWP